MKTGVKAIEDDPLNTDEVFAKSIKLEGRSQRNNPQIDGIKEEPNKTWNVKKIQNSITNKVGTESDVEIDRCHRTGPHKTKTGQNRDQPYTFVCTLNRFKDKQ